MACKGKVAAVVRRHSHNSTRAVAGQNVVAHPDGYALLGKRIDSVGACKNAAHLLHLGLALAFTAVLGPGHVGFHLGLAVGRGDAFNQLVLRAQHHKGDTEDSIGTCGENLKTRCGLGSELRHIGLCAGQHVGIGLHIEREPYGGTLAATNPVALYLFEALAPVHLLQSVDQTLGVGRYAQAPLAHQFALDGIAAAHRQAVDNLIVSQHRTQLGAPVDRYVGKVGQTIVHKQVLTLFLAHRVPLGGTVVALLELGNQLTYGAGLLKLLVVIVVEELQECPLRPFVVGGVAGAHLAVPVKAETYLVQLLTIAVDVLLSGDGRMLARLDCILLGRQAVGVISHRVQDVEATQPLVAGIDVAGYVAQRVADVQPRPRRIGEHIEHIIMRLVRIVLYVIGLLLTPVTLPFRFDFAKIVVHLSVFQSGFAGPSALQAAYRQPLGALCTKNTICKFTKKYFDITT